MPRVIPQAALRLAQQESELLVRFHSKASGGVTMFGDVATQLLRLMGMSGMVPGAVLALDVPEALRRLRRAAESSEGDRIPQPARQRDREGGKDEDDEQEVPQVNLRTRAYPLVKLLEAAATEECDVIWEAADKATG
jgi:hypothetical protein